MQEQTALALRMRRIDDCGRASFCLGSLDLPFNIFELAQLPHMLAAGIALSECLNLASSEVGPACCNSVQLLQSASTCSVSGRRKCTKNSGVSQVFVLLCCLHQLPFAFAWLLEMR